MKRELILFVFFLSTLFTRIDAQIYSPQLMGYNGFGTIFYPQAYYQGQVVNGIAHGTGTFYMSDGSFYYGNFFNGLYDGPGVFVSRLYGYISGCFSQGYYVGPCMNTVNPYQNKSDVEDVISQVQNNHPNNAPTGDFDPDGYKITKVDGNTEFGKSLMGAPPGGQ